MNKKTNIERDTIRIPNAIRSLVVLVALVTTLASCSDDDDPKLAKPVISNFEYGEGDAHSTDAFAYKGSDVHIEADILAEATVASIVVKIHSHDLTPADGEVEWDFEKTYTDTKYRVKNAKLHEHIDIPANIPAGEYHISLTVTDENGNSTEAEGHLDIRDVITIGEISLDATVTRGDDFHIEFPINAIHGIHHIIVDIHGHGVTPGEGEVAWHYEHEFEDGYHGLSEVEFHEHIDVPATAPAGEYHISITIEDEEGNTKEYEAHIDVEE